MLLLDPRLLVPSLVLFESLHYIFMRLLLGQLPPAPGGLYMMAIATAEVLVATWGRIHWAILRRHWRFFATVGVLVGVNTNLGILAMRYVDPGTAALLTRTSVVFGVALGVVWLRERLTPIEIVGGTMAVAGVMVVSVQPGDYLRLGSLIVGIATLLYAVHSAVVKRWGSAIPFLEFFLFRLAATTAVLVLLTAGQDALVWPPAAAWPLLTLAATINVVVSRALYYLALRRLDMTFLTIILTLSPVVTMLWSFLLFGSLPSPQEVIGGFAILVGVIVVSTSRGRPGR